MGLTGKITPQIQLINHSMPNISEICTFKFFMKLKPSQFQRRTVVSKIFTLILKGKMNMGYGKMALLSHRQGINGCHV
jgi:hypothetical protein